MIDLIKEFQIPRETVAQAPLLLLDSPTAPQVHRRSHRVLLQAGSP
jgi:hypothetical protein